MRCVGRVLSVLGVAGLLALGQCRPAAAESLWDPDLREFLGGTGPDTFMLFSGLDLWRDGFSLHGGVLWAPNGLTENGFVFKLLTATGAYRYHSGGVDVYGFYGLIAPMAGVRYAQ